jgi:hypothetical protein
MLRTIRDYAVTTLLVTLALVLANLILILVANAIA